MSRILAAIAVCALSSPAHAVDVCRGFDISRGDPHRGPSLVISNGLSSVSQIDGAPVLRVPFYEVGATSQPVAAGTEVDWHLADGSVVTTYSRDSAPPASISYGGDGAPVGVNTRWLLAFVLTDDAVHALARSPAERFRYTLISTPVDATSRRANSVGWQRLMACYAMQTAE